MNERDELGSDLVPDYMTSVRDGAFYGWPYSYYGANVDKRVKPPRPDLVAEAIAPDYALGPHTASLGLAYAGDFARRRPSATACSWASTARGTGARAADTRSSSCRSTTAGPSGPPVDVLTGFVRENGEAMGRPVGVAVDKRGGLLVADDVGNSIWRVTGATSTASTTP